MKLLHALGDEAAGPCGVDRASFVAGALRGVSIGLCRGDLSMYRACLGMLVKSGGTGLSCTGPRVLCWHTCAHRWAWVSVGSGKRRIPSISP
jgi:hypothetical protein